MAGEGNLHVPLHHPAMPICLWPCLCRLRPRSFPDIPPRPRTSTHANSYRQGLRVRHWDFQQRLHPAQDIVLHVGGVLAGYGIVDLQLNPDFRKLLADGKKTFVDDDGDGGLRNPSEGFRKERFDAPEEAVAEAEGVANLAAGSELGFRSAMPVLDTWMSGEPIALHELALVDGEATVQGHRAGGTAVVAVPRYAYFTFMSNEPETCWCNGAIN